jgi:hypothetical protein
MREMNYKTELNYRYKNESIYMSKLENRNESVRRITLNTVNELGHYNLT